MISAGGQALGGRPQGSDRGRPRTPARPGGRASRRRRSLSVVTSAGPLGGGDLQGIAGGVAQRVPAADGQHPHGGVHRRRRARSRADRRRPGRRRASRRPPSHGGGTDVGPATARLLEADPGHRQIDGPGPNGPPDRGPPRWGRRQPHGSRARPAPTGRWRPGSVAPSRVVGRELGLPAEARRRTWGTRGSGWPDPVRWWPPCRPRARSARAVPPGAELASSGQRRWHPNRRRARGRSVQQALRRGQEGSPYRSEPSRARTDRSTPVPGRPSARSG